MCISLPEHSLSVNFRENVVVLFAALCKIKQLVLFSEKQKLVLKKDSLVFDIEFSSATMIFSPESNQCVNLGGWKVLHFRLLRFADKIDFRTNRNGCLQIRAMESCLVEHQIFHQHLKVTELAEGPIFLAILCVTAVCHVASCLPITTPNAVYMLPRYTILIFERFPTFALIGGLFPPL
jgi:hypothetical protein